MKFLFVCPTIDNYVSGPYWSVYGLITGLLNNGHDVVLITTSKKNVDNISDIYTNLAERSNKFKLIILRNEEFIPFDFSFSFFKCLFFIGKVDYISIQSPFLISGWLAFLVAKLRSIPCSISIRGEFLNFKNLRKPSKKYSLFFIKFVLNNVSQIHYLNDKEIRVLKYLGVNNSCFYIPNGCHFVVNRNLKRQRIFLYLGRIIKEKNIINLIKAWRQSSTLDYKLLLVGNLDINFKDELLSVKGFDDSILVLPEVYGVEKSNLLISSEWIILPSLREGMPMSILEAISHGVLSIISHECNLQEFVQNECSLLTGTTVDSISKAIDTAIKLEDARKNLNREKSYDLIQKNYLWDDIAMRFISEARKVL